MSSGFLDGDHDEGLAQAVARLVRAEDVQVGKGEPRGFEPGPQEPAALAGPLDRLVADRSGMSSSPSWAYLAGDLVGQVDVDDVDHVDAVVGQHVGDHVVELAGGQVPGNGEVVEGVAVDDVVLLGAVVSLEDELAGVAPDGANAAGGRFRPVSTGRAGPSAIWLARVTAGSISATSADRAGILVLKVPWETCKRRRPGRACSKACRRGGRVLRLGPGS